MVKITYGWTNRALACLAGSENNLSIATNYLCNQSDPTPVCLGYDRASQPEIVTEPHAILDNERTALGGVIKASSPRFPKWAGNRPGQQGLTDAFPLPSGPRPSKKEGTG